MSNDLMTATSSWLSNAWRFFTEGTIPGTSITFGVLAIGLAIVNKKPKAKESLEATATEMQAETQTSEEATATETTDSNWWESSEASAE